MGDWGNERYALQMPTVEELKIKLRDYVQKNRLKTSSRRDLILETFTTIGRHVTADELFRAVRDRDDRIGAATVYRTLRVLQDSGIVVERNFEGGSTRFELIEDEHHDHLICTQCKSITEYEDETVERAQEAVAKKFGFVVHYHRHELYGLCAKCQKNS